MLSEWLASSLDLTVKTESHPTSLQLQPSSSGTVAASCGLRLGVVIPCYNAARFLAASLGSVWSQEVLPDEVLVVDDCSTDRSVEIARSLGARVFGLAENSGPASARNVGIEALSSCDLIAFLDCDDLWAPDHLALLKGCFDDASVGAAFGRIGRFGEQASPRRRELSLPPRRVFAELLAGNFIPQSSTIVRRDLFREAGGYRDGARFAEDYDAWLRMSLVSMFVEVPCVTAYRRTHDLQASRHTAKLFNEALLARERGIELAESVGIRVEQSLKDETLQQLLDDALETARFRADAQLRDAVLTSVAPTSYHARAVRRWSRRHLPLWPYYNLKAMLRRLVGRGKQRQVGQGAEDAPSLES